MTKPAWPNLSIIPGAAISPDPSFLGRARLLIVANIVAINGLTHCRYAHGMTLLRFGASRSPIDPTGFRGRGHRDIQYQSLSH